MLPNGGRRAARFVGPDSPLAKALAAPGGALSDPDIWNTPALHAAELPSANGICDARSLARMYAACVGEVDGSRLLTPEQLAIGGTRSFGHFGFGGSFGWADPDAELAMGYVMNRLDVGLAGDVRSAKLIGACYLSSA